MRALPNPPAQFGFKDAKQALGAPNNRTNEFLKKCRQHQLIEKLAKNHYRKLATPSGSAPTPANSPVATTPPCSPLKTSMNRVQVLDNV